MSGCDGPTNTATATNVPCACGIGASSLRGHASPQDFGGAHCYVVTTLSTLFLYTVDEGLHGRNVLQSVAIDKVRLILIHTYMLIKNYSLLVLMMA